MDTPPIRHENLEDQVLARLRGMIASGALPPGSRLRQEDLALRLGVSRTPLIAALKRLTLEGLAVWKPRCGASVAALDDASLADLLEVRLRLEPMAAELAARRIEPAEARALRARWEELARSPDTPEHCAAFVESDRLFHWRLAELSGNRFLLRSLEPLNMLAGLYLHGTPRPWEDTAPEHLAVIQALEAQSPEGAALAMRRHIQRSLDALRETLPQPPALTGR
ncbi:putative D-xylose utilization operon transcriptional repressor [Fundidesulfovibrio magnetotacticus]|uniref:Putative D-xylose utilization operon transcriptional repressor n=1 Tax=Fundidesulfovibrio magnetotacticus TaxID=2730080 RepID=A0A6V8LJD7_9BACT|nr:GntR family transcriptional regulator [Fundidesulfovibrio magnetotacticus]GFK92852.1 putative D-xylose utilization operon transcriptional repressor [Fundidesulfovibrio magnetotacticus]